VNTHFVVSIMQQLSLDDDDDDDDDDVVVV
jgi:hypothetical protein